MSVTVPAGSIDALAVEPHSSQKMSEACHITSAVLNRTLTRLTMRVFILDSSTPKPTKLLNNLKPIDSFDKKKTSSVKLQTTSSPDPFVFNSPVKVRSVPFAGPRPPPSPSPAASPLEPELPGPSAAWGYAGDRQAKKAKEEEMEDDEDEWEDEGDDEEEEEEDAEEDDKATEKRLAGRYWKRRFELWRRYNEGILMDEVEPSPCLALPSTCLPTSQL
ncbi:hypothetical protein T492DRAFT_832175 [Pavlovales sp. CCMP2436]|nr:hypothetical protein T492DRAFT_832175 [Pavlovales sp. CCMP2436]